MTFKGAIDSLFDCERRQLAACGEPVESAVDPEPEPEPPSEDAVIEVVAEWEDGSIFQGPTSNIAYQKLEQLPFKKLRALAKHRKVSGKGDARDLVKRIFESGITPDELNDFSQTYG